MRQIDADAFKTDVRRYVLEGTDEFGTISVEVAERSFLRLIDRQPTIEAEPVRHGRWISFLDGDHIMPERYYKCSRCGRVEYRQEPYCHCGAKMDGGADG